MTVDGFSWTIDESAAWPPSLRPRPPFGPTALEVIRSCPLRVCFEASAGYARRSGFAARVGTAFHSTLEDLSANPPCGGDDQVAEAARTLFMDHLATQETQAAVRPREAGLPREEDRVQRAIEAVMVEAQRLARFRDNRVAGDISTTVTADLSTGLSAELEVPVRSREGLFHGRIDRAERTPAGIRLIDYKSALRPDLPERYERQLQLYAYLWHDETGEWPVEAAVVYPLVPFVHPVRVDSETCREVALDAAMQIDRLHAASDTQQLGTPGDVCKVCEFRPWCRPFWDWQAEAGVERAGIGLEGKIAQIRRQDTHWFIELMWRDNPALLAAEGTRFPQLERASVGTTLRVLDVRLHGLRHRPRVQTTDYTEIFIVDQDG